MSEWVSEGVKNVIVIIYNLYDLVCWKIFCFWVKSILGNYETTLHSYFLPGDIDWYGCRWTDVHCFSIVDCRWHYSIGDVTFIMDYFNFSFSAFKSSRLSPCSPPVLSKWFHAADILHCAVFDRVIYLGHLSQQEWHHDRHGRLHSVSELLSDFELPASFVECYCRQHE